MLQTSGTVWLGTPIDLRSTSTLSICKYARCYFDDARKSPDLFWNVLSALDSLTASAPTASTMPTKTNTNSTRVYLSLLSASLLVAAAAFVSFPYWQSPFVVATSTSTSKSTSASSQHHTGANSQAPEVIRLSKQACANLGLCNGNIELQTYWKKIQTTGVIADRPGLTDRSVTSPLDCVITKVHAMEGDIVQPGDKLFTLRIVSEYLQQTQSNYFKAIKEIEILKREIKRIQSLANSGVIPEKRIINLKQDIARQQAELDAHGQELLARGFDARQISRITSGKFVSSIEITVPQPQADPPEATSKISQIGFEKTASDRKTFLEVQELNVHLGQQIKSGELLAVLANHHFLYIKGHAFKKEATDISRATENNWSVEVEFLEDAATDWEPLQQPLKIRHLANTVDPENRTFDFFIPLNNQSRNYLKNENTFVVWRFRPGQRVRIHVPTAELKDVIVLPSEAVINDGPNAYVFQQNGDLYNRIGVNVIYRDRINTVIANDGSLLAGFSVAINAAASLNRILKVQNASGENTGNFHVHADGSVHENH